MDSEGEVKNVVLGAGYSRKVVESGAYQKLGFDKAIPESSKVVPAPNLALLQTCSQVYQEALPMGWLNSVKCFERATLDCCQLDMVDMVCTFAFPYVSWILNIKLVGYVKTAPKKKWERIFNNERKGASYDHDQEAAMAALLHAPADILSVPLSFPLHPHTSRVTYTCFNYE